jgi:hypothetical protein
LSKLFETVLKEVFDSWKPQLKPTSHKLLLWVLAPKIISDKFADDKKKKNHYRRNYCQFIYGFNFDWEQNSEFFGFISNCFCFTNNFHSGSTIDDKR